MVDLQDSYPNVCLLLFTSQQMLVHAQYIMCASNLRDILSLIREIQSVIKGISLTFRVKTIDNIPCLTTVLLGESGNIVS